MRDFHVVTLEPKMRILRLFVPSLEKYHFRCTPRRHPSSVPNWPTPDPLDLQTVATTDSCSSTTTGLVPPPAQLSGHAAHLRWQVQNRRGNRERRLWSVVLSLVSRPTSLTSSSPLQVQCTSARIQWLGRRSLSNFSPPSPVIAPSDKNQRYTRPSPALLVYPGLCGLENTEISTS